jgi:hypothetical protein
MPTAQFFPGTIAAVGSQFGPRGVGFDARIMPLRIFDEFGVAVDRLAEAIRYASDKGALIINLSLGWTSDPGVISVGAINNQRQLADFSAYAGHSPALTQVKHFGTIFRIFGRSIDRKC